MLSTMTKPTSSHTYGQRQTSYACSGEEEEEEDTYSVESDDLAWLVHGDDESSESKQHRERRAQLYDSRRRLMSALQLLGLVAGIILFAVLVWQSQEPDPSPLPIRPTRSAPTVVDITAKSMHSAPSPRPPLQDLIGDLESDIKADVQWLLDFAIIGHSKCATTAQESWLRNHPEILFPQTKELRSLTKGRPAEMVSVMYALPEGNAKRGYKAPNDIRSIEALGYIHTYWPKTKLIIGVRHPVKWFESYYNYNARQGNHLGPAKDMIGDKLPDQAKFHLHLSQLGKTNVLDPVEQELLGTTLTKQPVRMNNQVFLYEVSQPFDSREGRDTQYRKDMQEFLGLSTPLDPIKVRTRQSPNYHYAIDICEDKYRILREELIEEGKDAAAWITRYFMKQPDVTVSSPEYFKELLQSWSTDPCDKK